jgi:hypothetical protein
VPLYRKKPVVVEAMHWDGYPVTATVIIDWMLASDGTARYHDDPSALNIDTLEGTMTAYSGDWIIKGVKGEFYPVKDPIFRETYELADGMRKAAPGG